MGMTWTDDQRKVIELRDRNILVSAAAGSGKTAVLVERIIKIITNIYSVSFLFYTMPRSRRSTVFVCM